MVPEGESAHARSPQFDIENGEGRDDIGHLLLTRHKVQMQRDYYVPYLAATEPMFLEPRECCNND